MGKVVHVTMADVGKAAGVSQTAVSLALRNDPSIPSATRERIRVAAHRLGYQPHGAISSLMAQIRSKRPRKYRPTLAALTDWPDLAEFKRYPTWRLQWEGARQRAKELGYSLEEFGMGRNGLSAARIAKVLEARGIEGVIVFPLSNGRALALPWERLASVAIGYTLELPLLHRVVTAHFDSVLMALEQLRVRGYRRIGVVLDEQLNLRVHRSWLAAFCAYGFENGRISPRAIANLPAVGAKAALGRWLRSYQPDAVLCGGAYPIRKWLRELGRSAPESIGIVCLAALLPDEGCACIDEDWLHVGAAAVDGVVGQLSRGERGIPSHPILSVIRGEWIDGDSIRSLPEQNSHVY